MQSSVSEKWNPPQVRTYTGTSTQVSSTGHFCFKIVPDTTAAGREGRSRQTGCFGLLNKLHRHAHEERPFFDSGDIWWVVTNICAYPAVEIWTSEWPTFLYLLWESEVQASRITPPTNAYIYEVITLSAIWVSGFQLMTSLNSRIWLVGAWRMRR